MLNELTEKAKKIENTTDANFGGALVQVTNDLTLAECKDLFAEIAGGDPKKIKRWAKKISRVEDKVDPRWFSLAGLRNDAMTILENHSHRPYNLK